MFQCSEGFFKGYHDAQLFFQTWEKPNSEFTLLITHGMGEHSGSYYRLIEALKDLPISIVAWDLRGHGRSEGRRGYVNHFNEFSEDMYCLLKKMQDPSKPLITLAHSMGGLIQLKTLIDHPELSPKAQVLSSPLIGLSTTVPFYKHYFALTAHQLMNFITLDSELVPEILSRDPEVQKTYDQDYLRHAKISPAIYMGFLNVPEYIMSKASQLKTPSYFQVAGADQLVSAQKTQEFYSLLTMKHKKMYFYPDSAHEIYNDSNREEVYEDLKDIFKKILNNFK